MRRAALACWVAIAIAPLIATYAHADGKRPSPEAVKAAQNHMTKARSLYEAGDYPDAIAELETARALDPYAKDLVFNLGIVHEKALHIEEALHFYRLYLDLDIEPAERARAETIIKRLEGARTHVQPTATATTTVVVPPPTATAIIAAPPGHGRFDGLTATMGFLALAGFGVGAGFGVLALASGPPNNYVTGAPGDPGVNGTYTQLKSMVDQAHFYATIADIGFISGAVFTIVTFSVFFGRTKKSDAHPSLTISPTARGVIVGGTF